MEQLKYKTRGDSSPQGKPRVYFCCHPQDHSAFFDRISDEILEKQNCAVWYLTDPHAQRSELLLGDLKQMQLFVMPVTYRLLSTPNPALDTEFRFAMENHIPVLPLMQERGLETLFNEKCGDLQFLDKHTQDATAIRYEEKLEKYLDSVLVGDKLAEKIRAAFDAYVFLSYRKKDRRYAQELMRLIHKNDFCRDIAIWYDEFLTPGENFNDSIKAALEKSGLFVLAVTPNLVNETNYIMTTEYPMARTAKKPILPAELVPTDKASLDACYEGLPPCTDAHDDTALSQALQDALRKIAIKESRGSLEHDFFIGLAYLGGVDVEVDHERAVKLITSAAENGLVEAMDKLVSMYRTGLGVARDHQAAVVWLERKISALEKEKQDDVWNGIRIGFDGLEKLLHARKSCAEYYLELCQPQKALEKYQQAKQDAEEFPDFTRMRRNVGEYCLGIGSILLSQGDLSGAKEHFQQALAITQALTEKENSDLERMYMALCQRSLGDVAYEQGQLAVAKEHFEAYLAIWEQFLRDEALPTVRVSCQSMVGAGYDRLGEVARAAGDYDTAQSWYEKLLAVSKEYEYFDNSGVHAAYQRLGDLAILRKDSNTARRWYEALAARQEAEVERLDTPVERNLLFACYSRLALVLQMQGLSQEAEAYAVKGLSLCESLLQNSTDLTLRLGQAGSYELLGRLAVEQGDVSSAIKHHKKALDLRQQLAQENPTVQIRRLLAGSYEALGGGAMIQEAFSSAAEYLREALAIREKLASETENAEDKLQLFRCYTFRAGSALGQRDRGLAKTLSEKAISALEALQQDDENPQILSMLAEAYYIAGAASVLKRRRRWNQAISIYERLSRMYPDVKAYQRQLQILKQ